MSDFGNRTPSSSQFNLSSFSRRRIGNKFQIVNSSSQNVNDSVSDPVTETQHIDRRRNNTSASTSTGQRTFRIQNRFAMTRPRYQENNARHVIILARVSSNRQSTKYNPGQQSLASQIDFCKTYAGVNNLVDLSNQNQVDKIHVITDVGSASGDNFSKLKGLKRIQSLITTTLGADPSATFDTIVYDTTRFGRNAIAAQQWIADWTHAKNNTLHFATESVSTNNIQASMPLITQNLYMAQNESDTLKRRIKQSFQFRRKLGSYVGPAIFGYEIFNIPVKAVVPSSYAGQSQDEIIDYRLRLIRRNPVESQIIDILKLAILKIPLSLVTNESVGTKSLVNPEGHSFNKLMSYRDLRPITYNQIIEDAANQQRNIEEIEDNIKTVRMQMEDAFSVAPNASEQRKAEIRERRKKALNNHLLEKMNLERYHYRVQSREKIDDIINELNKRKFYYRSKPWTRKSAEKFIQSYSSGTTTNVTRGLEKTDKFHELYKKNELTKETIINGSGLTKLTNLRQALPQIDDFPSPIIEQTQSQKRKRIREIMERSDENNNNSTDVVTKKSFTLSNFSSRRRTNENNDNIEMEEFQPYRRIPHDDMVIENSIQSDPFYHDLTQSEIEQLQILDDLYEIYFQPAFNNRLHKQTAMMRNPSSTRRNNDDDDDDETETDDELDLDAEEYDSDEEQMEAF